MTVDRIIDQTYALEILAVPIVDPDDAEHGETIRDYLIALLQGLWERRDQFDGKRPFGSSIWWHRLYDPLIRAGMIAGSFDEDGYIQECDDERGDELIAAAIAELGTIPLTRSPLRSLWTGVTKPRKGFGDESSFIERQVDVAPGTKVGIYVEPADG